LSKMKRFAEASAKHQTPTTLEEVDQQIYGAMRAPDAGRQVARPILIQTIYPDPIQPRRAIPSAVRDAWDGDPATVATDLFDVWLEKIAEERGSPFELAAYLSEGETPRSQSDEAESDDADSVKRGALEAALLPVVELAASIRRTGLTNPITVVKFSEDENGTKLYRLETGERRWLAYHLLLRHFGKDDLNAKGEKQWWDRIPAREVEGFNVWRQASENNARQNLNAIAKARQLALLIMDLYQAQGIAFQPFDVFAHEQDYYKQVVDANAYKIPRGMGEKIISTMGAEHRNIIMRYRSLLELPPSVWTIADDYHLPEGKLRDLKGLPEEKAFALIRSWIGEEQQLSPSGDTSPERPLDNAPVSAAWSIMERSMSMLHKLKPDKLKAMGQEDRQAVQEMIATYRRLLDEIDDWLK